VNRTRRKRKRSSKRKSEVEQKDRQTKKAGRRWKEISCEAATGPFSTVWQAG
jgi:hypothetical protein